jgi:PIN domain nuclease of toxin-antitoxin system
MATKVRRIQVKSQLSSFHRDPFDRMIICQALEQSLTIITVDDAFLGIPFRFWNVHDAAPGTGDLSRPA